MFLNLRQGSQVFLLHKTATPFVETGTVESTSNMQIGGYYPIMQQYPIDITVRVNDKVVTYQRLPVNAESADASDPVTKEQVTVACSKDAINNEIQNMRNKSIEAINSVQYHKQRIEALDRLVAQMNPEAAEKAAQAEELNTLKIQMSTMTKNISDLMAVNKKLLEKIKSMDDGTSSDKKHSEP